MSSNSCLGQFSYLDHFFVFLEIGLEPLVVAMFLLILSPTISLILRFSGVARSTALQPLKEVRSTCNLSVL